MYIVNVLRDKSGVLKMTQEKKVALLYWATVALIVSVIAGLTLLNPDLGFDVIVAFMAAGVAAALVQMGCTWSKTGIFLRWLSVMSFVGMIYWTGHLKEYYEEKARGPIAVYSHPCEDVDPDEPIVVRQGERVTLVGMMGTESLLICAIPEATAQAIAY